MGKPDCPTTTNSKTTAPIRVLAAIDGQNLRDLVYSAYDETRSDADFRKGVKIMLELAASPGWKL